MIEVKKEQLDMDLCVGIIPLCRNNIPEVYGKWSGGKADNSSRRIQEILYYLLMQQEEGDLAFFSAKNEDGELVGYAVCYDLQHSHIGQHYLQVDSVYVAPEYRGKQFNVTMKLLAEMEQYAKDHELAFIYFSMPERVGKYMQKFGYRPMEIGHVKMIEA